MGQAPEQGAAPEGRDRESPLDREFIKVIGYLGGEEAVRIIEALKRLGEVTDEALANDVGIRINDVRKILLKLYEKGLISAVRVQDESTGWYIFLWRIQPDQVDTFIRSRRRKVLEKLKRRLSYEESRSFFRCDRCKGVYLSFDEAMERAFMCPGCGGPLAGIDNSKAIERIREIIRKLEAE
ncbi:MAG: transcription factor [Candidatus Bathyarchaeia archaeon]